METKETTNLAAVTPGQEPSDNNATTPGAGTAAVQSPKVVVVDDGPLLATRAELLACYEALAAGQEPRLLAPGVLPVEITPGCVSDSVHATVLGLRLELQREAVKRAMLMQQVAELEARPLIPATDSDLRAAIEAAPVENLRWLYEAGQLVRDSVNDRWSRNK